MSTSARARRDHRPGRRDRRAAHRTSTGHASAAVAAATGAESVPSGLLYVSDDRPGIRRIRKGDGFVYRHADGKPVRNAAELERIRKLAIPPAYEDVWICPHPQRASAGHRSRRSRPQAVSLSPGVARARDADKFDRMLEFGAALPRIRRRVATDLAKPVERSRPRETGARDAGASARAHARPRRQRRVRAHQRIVRSHDPAQSPCRTVSGGTLQLRFRGKSGVDPRGRARRIRASPASCGAARRCPGRSCSSTIDESRRQRRPVDSSDVNDYIREASGAAFTAKDFRTWHGTVHALTLWAEQMAADAASRLSANQVLAEVARRLGNTVAVCKKAYVHPRVLQVLAADSADRRVRCCEGTDAQGRLVGVGTPAARVPLRSRLGRSSIGLLAEDRPLPIPRRCGKALGFAPCDPGSVL